MGKLAPYKRIVVPLDGSEAAERAVSFALELVRRFRMSLHLVRIVGDGGLSAVSDLAEPDLATAATYLEQIRAGLADLGLAVTTEVRPGSLGCQLLAVTRPGDIVVIAAAGRDSAGLPGSVTDGVLEQARVPVIVVPAGDV